MPDDAGLLPGKGTLHDPRGLIQESFRIEGVAPEDCRSIFFDWVLGLPADTDSAEAVRHMLDLYRSEPDAHPMKAVLREGLQPRQEPRRRSTATGRDRARRRRGDSEPEN